MLEIHGLNGESYYIAPKDRTCYSALVWLAGGAIVYILIIMYQNISYLLPSVKELNSDSLVSY